MALSMNITEPSFDESEIAILRVCLGSKWVTQGPLTERFERLIASKHGVGSMLLRVRRARLPFILRLWR